MARLRDLRPRVLAVRCDRADPALLLLTSILFITGIPPTEEQSIRSKGGAYRSYQARVSQSIPRQPKRA